jgi:hypothetical protein
MSSYTSSFLLVRQDLTGIFCPLTIVDFCPVNIHFVDQLKIVHMHANEFLFKT